MANIPLGATELPARKRVQEQVGELLRTAGALVLALLAILLLGGLLQQLPPGLGGAALHDLVPVDNLVAASSFTA